MKRRFFIAGLIAAPAAIAAPAIAEVSGAAQTFGQQKLHTPSEAKRLLAKIDKAEGAKRSGFTADELQRISDVMIEHYIAAGRNHQIGILAPGALG